LATEARALRLGGWGAVRTVFRRNSRLASGPDERDEEAILRYGGGQGVTGEDSSVGCLKRPVILLRRWHLSNFMKTYLDELKAYLRPPWTIPVAILLVEISRREKLWLTRTSALRSAKASQAAVFIRLAPRLHPLHSLYPSRSEGNRIQAQSSSVNDRAQSTALIWTGVSVTCCIAWLLAAGCLARYRWRIIYARCRRGSRGLCSCDPQILTRQKAG
jgi:hypothetical protein